MLILLAIRSVDVVFVSSFFIGEGESPFLLFRWRVEPTDLPYHGGVHGDAGADEEVRKKKKSFTFFFSISVVADGPPYYHPACGH